MAYGPHPSPPHIGIDIGITGMAGITGIAAAGMAAAQQLVVQLGAQLGAQPPPQK